MLDASYVVDTNVLLVAGRQHQDVTPDCVVECALRLKRIMEVGRIALDDGYEILGEYLHKNVPARQKHLGDLFAQWAVRNWRNPERCELARLERDAEGEYTAFPKHPDLANFDPPDKKFVAVAATLSVHPPILEAADSKWLDWAPALEECGLTVSFICTADLERFHQKKFGS